LQDEDERSESQNKSVSKLNSHVLQTIIY
jgi:hypothetical protein